MIRPSATSTHHPKQPPPPPNTQPQIHAINAPPRTRPERVLRPMAPIGVCAASPVVAAVARLPRVAIPLAPPPRLRPAPASLPPLLLLAPLVGVGLGLWVGLSGGIFGGVYLYGELCVCLSVPGRAAAVAGAGGAVSCVCVFKG